MALSDLRMSLAYLVTYLLMHVSRIRAKWQSDIEDRAVEQARESPDVANGERRLLTLFGFEELSDLVRHLAGNPTSSAKTYGLKKWLSAKEADREGAATETQLRLLRQAEAGEAYIKELRAAADQALGRVLECRCPAEDLLRREDPGKADELDQSDEVWQRVVKAIGEKMPLELSEEERQYGGRYEDHVREFAAQVYVGDCVGGHPSTQRFLELDREGFTTELVEVLQSKYPKVAQAIEGVASEHSKLDIGPLVGGGGGSDADRTRLAEVANRLNDRQQSILAAMYQLKAFDARSKRTTEKIGPEAEGPDVNLDGIKRAIAELVRRRLVSSRAGRHGGCFLTAEGKALAEFIITR